METLIWWRPLCNVLPINHSINFRFTNTKRDSHHRRGPCWVTSSSPVVSLNSGLQENSYVCKLSDDRAVGHDFLVWSTSQGALFVCFVYGQVRMVTTGFSGHGEQWVGVLWVPWVVSWLTLCQVLPSPRTTPRPSSSASYWVRQIFSSLLLLLRCHFADMKVPVLLLSKYNFNLCDSLVYSVRCF